MSSNCKLDQDLKDKAVDSKLYRGTYGEEMVRDYIKAIAILLTFGHTGGSQSPAPMRQPSLHPPSN